MPSPPRLPLIPVLTGLLSLSLAACAGQPASVGTTAQSEIADAESLPVYHEASLTETPGLVAEAEKPLVLQVEGASSVAVDAADLGGLGQDVVPLRYARGVEETVRWEGDGTGVAELENEHGQLIWRVTEGGEPFSGLVPAGLYTLTVRGGSAQDAPTLVLDPEAVGTTLQRNLFWRDQANATRGQRDPLNFSYSVLNDVDFSDRDLTGANFEGAVLYHGNFDRVRLTRANFGRAMLTDVSLRGATLDGVRLYRTELYNVRLDPASMREITPVEALFKGCNLSGTDMSGALFVRSTLKGNDFTGAKVLPSQFVECVLSGNQGL